MLTFLGSIQKNAMPIIIKNYDLMACAQTGSGKTAAFLVPIISVLVKKISAGRLQTVRRQPRMRYQASPLFLIVLPTRELAIQIFNEARRVRLRFLLFYEMTMFTQVDVVLVS